MIDPLRPGLISEMQAREYNRELEAERRRRKTTEELRRKDLIGDSIAMARSRVDHHRHLAFLYAFCAALWTYGAATQHWYLLFAIAVFVAFVFENVRKARAERRTIDALRRDTSQR